MKGDEVTADVTKDLIFIIKDEDGNPLYRVRPYSSTYLCYVIDEWREVKSRKGEGSRLDWVQMECYPSTLDHACTILRKKLLMKSNVETSDLTEIKKAITRSTNRIIKAIEEGLKGVTDG